MPEAAELQERITRLHRDRARYPAPDHSLPAQAEALDDPGLLIHALIALAGACCFLEQWDHVESYGYRALEMLEDHPHLIDELVEPNVLDLHNRLSRAADTRGDLRAYCHHGTLAVAAANSSVALDGIAVCIHNVADSLFELGAVADAAAVLASARVRPLHDVSHKAMYTQLIARVSAAEGDRDTAIAYTREAADLAREDSGLAARVLRRSIEICANNGDAEHARHIADDFWSVRSELAGARGHDLVLQAHLALAEGRPEQARDYLAQAGQEIDPVDQRRVDLERRLVQAAVHLAHPAGDPAPVLEAAASFDVDGGSPMRFNNMMDELELAARERLGDLDGAIEVMDRLIERTEARSRPADVDPEATAAMRENLERIRVRMLADLAQEKADLGQMVAHDVRGVVQFLHLLLRLSDSTDPGDLSGHFGRSVQSILRLVETLEMLNSLDRGATHVDRHVVSVEMLIDDLRTWAKPVLAGKQQQLLVTIDVPTDTTLAIDPSLFTMIGMNLISNASKYSPRGSTVTVRVQLDNTHFTVGVVDEGPGIADDEVEAIFGRRAVGHANPTEGEPSLGVGLYIADRLIALTGGRIRVTSLPGGAGSCFTIAYPRALIDRSEPGPASWMEPST